MSYHRNDEALREAIETHSVEGMEVVVPIFNEAVIVSQGATGPVRHVTEAAVRLGNPMVYYKVKAKKPVDFETWLEKKNSPRGADPKIRRTLSGWKDLFQGKLPLIPDYMMVKLESGEALSPADVEYDSLVQRGCINVDGKVSCYTFWQNEVHINPRQLKRGELVEYEYGHGEEHATYQGSIVGFTKDKKVAYLELFTPLPYLELPDSLSSEDIQKSFYPEATYALGYGTFEAFEIAAEESGENLIPPGKWDTEVVKDRRIYTLKEFLPLTVIEDLCKAAYGDEPHCVWQSLIVYVVPIRLYDVTYSGIWHPLPKNAVQIDAVISYEEEGEE